VTLRVIECLRQTAYTTSVTGKSFNRLEAKITRCGPDLSHSRGLQGHVQYTIQRPSYFGLVRQGFQTTAPGYLSRFESARLQLVTPDLLSPTRPKLNTRVLPTMTSRSESPPMVTVVSMDEADTM
jgi:hypothetical protein